MKLSCILENMSLEQHYTIQDEMEFEALGLIGSLTDLAICTFLDDKKYLNSIPLNAKMIIITKDLAVMLNNNNRRGICIVENPRIVFFTVHNYLCNQPMYRRKAHETKIGQGCTISKLSHIADRNVIIGNDVIIEEFVSIKENTVIGNNCIIRAGSVIGGEGFEFKRAGIGVLSVKHLGGVILGDNVEVQSNSCVDKAVYPWDNTIVGNNSKIDNLVYIAHGTKIGMNTLIVGQSGILGRAIIGDNVKVGLGAGIKNAINIGNSSDISIGAVITEDVSEAQKVSGNFGIEHDKFIKFIKSIR